MVTYEDLSEAGKKRVDEFMKAHENPQLMAELSEMVRIGSKRKAKTYRDYIIDRFNWINGLDPKERVRRVNGDILRVMESEGFPSEELLQELEAYYKLDLRGVCTEKDLKSRASVSITMVLVEDFRSTYLEDLKHAS